MSHHKRRKPKNQRAGCLMCKPHKANHAKRTVKEAPVDKRTRESMEQEEEEWKNEKE